MTETAYIINTLFILIAAILVMFMSAGFAMLEAGTVRSKSVGVILVKNVALYAIAGFMFWLVGYNLMYMNVDGGLIGTPLPYAPDDAAALAGDFSAGHTSEADWFFQMVFVATAASIVSGALAERIKLWPFFFFVALLCGLIYPTVGSWVWGGGWLSEMGFKDFAGSTLVHSVGGWAALTGAIILGARRGRFGKDGVRVMAPTSLTMTTLGTFILWFGWFGFNGGSQLAIASTEDALAVGKILANTNMAAAAGTMAILLFYKAMDRKIDLPMLLNGTLAGLVAITAEPLKPSIGMAMLIGGSGAFVMLLVSMALEKVKIDDVVGAVPVHLGAGIFGTIVVCLSNPETTFMTQIVGVLAIGAFTGTISLLLWAAMRATVSIRLRWSEENQGSDMAELGMKAHNLEYDVLTAKH